MVRSVPRPSFLYVRPTSARRELVRCGAAVLLAGGALAGSGLFQGARPPIALICTFAVLLSALIGGYMAGWIALAITGTGLWIAVLGKRMGDFGSLQSSLVLWCAYIALGVVLVEVIRRLQRERRRLLEHDQRLRLARRAARIWFWEWDLQTNVLSWSRETDHGTEDKHYEVPLENYVNRRVHGEDRDLFLTRLFEAAARHHRFELDYRVMEGDGTVRWLSSKGRIFEENGSTMMLGMASEITAQKQAEEVRSQFRAVLGSLIEGVCYTDTAGAIQYLNPAAESMLGYKSEEVRGRHLHDLLHLACAPNQNGSCCLRNAIIAGHPCRVQEERLSTKSGEQLIAEYTVAPVISDGSTLGAVMMFRDISERKRAEEAVRASEKMAVTGRIAATISHELRNPLDSVMQLLYLVKHSERLGDAERQQLDLIDQELHRMTEVAQQTLAMHRQSASMVPVNLAKLIDGILLLYGKKIRSHKIEVKRRYDWHGEIPGFPAELRQVFGNLIVNAVDAMPSGGRLILHIRHHREPAVNGRDGVQVSLFDTGSGIPQDIRKHLFEPFFTTKGEKGSGVGLWVSGGIVQRHHGTIRVHSDSRPGRSYTCFQVFFPEKQPQVRPLESVSRKSSKASEPANKAA
ncbi:MAG TPA: PAS domain S-box protein [Terriglobales bacterium]|nr:PAS domain S-box protein [Terriglobales bacterium]